MVERDTILSFNFYTYGKPFTGSDKGKRYRIVKEERELPAEEGEEPRKEKYFDVCVWPEPFSYDNTEEEKKIRKNFTFSEKGLEEALDFINNSNV